MCIFYVIQCIDFQKQPVGSALNHLDVNPTKWSNMLKQLVGNLPRNCLNVFDYFVGLLLKGLKNFGKIKTVVNKIHFIVNLHSFFLSHSLSE